MSTVFLGKLAEHLNFGHVLEISAKADIEASWFSISLATGKSNEHELFDVGLQMLAQLNEEQIVFKQQLNGEWLEVVSDEFDMELFRQQFKVVIVMDEEKFHISVNRESFIFVRYGLPVNRLNTLQIEGHLTAIKQVDHRKYFPSPWPPIHKSDDQLHFSHDVPVMFQPGHVMVITMKLLCKMDGRFHMNFHSVWNSKRLEVHVSVDFDSKKVIRNSKLPLQNINGNPEKTTYGAEESDGVFPFDDMPKYFKLAVGFTPTSLKMAKDGVFLFEYAFKTPNILPHISGVKISGINGMTARVSAIDHLRLDDPLCEAFEQYSDAS